MTAGIKSLVVFISCCCSLAAYSQGKDSVSTETKQHSPKLATILSASIPGAGQVYNRKYWKVPVIYAGFAGFGYGFLYNNDKYKKYKDAYILSLDSIATNDIYDGIYSSDNLKSLMDGFHRWRDINVIGFAFVYVLNIVDAAVDAHLMNFNAQINSDLSLNIQPVFFSATFAGNHSAQGLRLTLSLH